MGENVKMKNLIILSFLMLTVSSAPAQKTFKLKNYLSNNIGAVKVRGEIFWKNPKGEITRTFKIDAKLESLGSLGGLGSYTIFT